MVNHLICFSLEDQCVPKSKSTLFFWVKLFFSVFIFKEKHAKLLCCCYLTFQKLQSFFFFSFFFFANKLEVTQTIFGLGVLEILFWKHCLKNCRIRPIMDWSVLYVCSDMKLLFLTFDKKCILVQNNFYDLTNVL